MIKTYLYNHKGSQMLHDVNIENKNELLQHEEDLLWVDLFKFTEQEIKYVAGVFGFHPLAVEDCITDSPRAKIDNYDSYYFFVMHALRYDENSEEEIELVQLGVFIGANFVVTVHSQTLPVLGRIARTSLQSPQFMNKGVEFFLYSIIDGNTDEIFPILDRIGVRIDELEDEMYGHPDREITEEFLSLKRSVLTIRRAVTPQKRIFTGINMGRYDYFDVKEAIKPYFFDLVDHLERITDSTDGYRELMDTSLATYYSIISARTNYTIRILTVISTIFMPLTFLTGFFGMNVPLPYQNTGLATISITAVLIAISVLMLAAFKKLKWI